MPKTDKKSHEYVQKVNLPFLEKRSCGKIKQDSEFPLDTFLQHGLLLIKSEKKCMSEKIVVF